MTRNTGWLQSLEDWDFLRGQERPFALSAPIVDAPDELDPADWHRVENQGRQNSCSGQAMASVVESIEFFETGYTVQLSRQFAYIMGQRLDGSRSDRGATITSCVRATRDTGLCVEKLAPYTGHYYTQFSPEAFEAAKRTRTTSHAWMRSYSMSLDFLRAKQGGIILGVPWTRKLRACSGRITLADAQDRRDGFHAVCLLGWRRDDPLILVNSHSKRWGHNGQADVDPEVIDWWCSHEGFSVTGVSKLTENYGEPQSWDFVKRNPWVGA